jgi:biopolymer transport protein ExbD
MFRTNKIRTSDSRGLVEISTAALPDIIFILLFFFMVISKVRVDEMLIDAKVPSVNEAVELKNSPLVHQIYIGKPKALKGSDTDKYSIQLGNKIGSIDDIGPYVEACRASVSPSKQKDMVMALKVDSDVPMALIEDVKLKLRQAKQYRVNYYVLTNKK